MCRSLWIAYFLLFLLSTFVSGQVDSQNFPAGVAERDALPTERTLSYEFDSVSIRSIERWLRWVNIDLPVDVEGEVSGWLWAQRSSRGLFVFSDYWLEGGVTSPKLQIDRWIIEGASLRFGYRNGAWYVGRLAGDVTPTVPQDQPEDGGGAGRIELAAQLPLDAQALLNVSGTVSKVDLASLLKGLAVAVPVKNRGGELTFSARVPIAQSNDLKYWTGEVNLRLEEVVVPPVRDPMLVTANAGLQEGKWRLRDSRFLLQSQEGVQIPLRLAADGPLESPWPFTVDASSSNVALDELLRQFGLQALADDLQGNAGVTATATGDADRGIHSATVQLEANDLIVEQQPVGSVSVIGNVIGNVAEVQMRSASFLNGTFIGNANWTDVRRTQQGKPNRLSFAFNDIQLSAVKWPWFSSQLAGAATGRINLQTETDADGRTAWGSDGELAIIGSIVEGMSLGNVELDWSKAFDQLEAYGSIQLMKDVGQANAEVAITLMDNVQSPVVADQVATFRATGSLHNFEALLPAAIVYQLMSRNEPLPLRATGLFDVAGSKNNFFERGSAELEMIETRFAGRDIQLVRAIIEASPAELRLRQFTLNDLTRPASDGGDFASVNGRVLGAGILRRDGTGEHLLRLALSDVTLGPYWGLLAPDIYKGLDGRVSSVIQLTLPASGRRDIRISKSSINELSGTLTGAVRGLSYNGASIGDLDFRGKLESGELEASAEGDVLEGTAEVSVEISDLLQQIWPEDDIKPVESRIDARLEAIQLEKLWVFMGRDRQTSDVRGSASIDVSATTRNSHLHSARGTFSVPRFFHNREVFAEDVAVDFDYSDSWLSIRQGQGRIAGGLVNVSGSIGWPRGGVNAAAGDLTYTIQQVDVGQLAMLLNPQIAEQFAGRISYRGRGRLGRSLTFLGAATTTNAVLYGFPLQSVSGSLQLDFDRDLRFQNLVASHLTGTALGGQASANIRLRGGPSYQLDARGVVRRGKMEQLSRALGFEHIVGSENFHASLELNSRDASSLAALRGRLQLEFDQGDAQSIPILADLNRLVPLMQLASTEITSGRMDARIGQGLLIIEDVLLNSEAFWIAGNGIASLRGGNLNLQGVMQTGGGIEARISQASVRRLATLLAPEVVLIAELDNLLRNRTLYFGVRGNTNRPVIQPKIAPSIARGLVQEVARALVATPRAMAISNQ